MIELYGICIAHIYILISLVSNKNGLVKKLIK